jgi:hypothetical protein
MLKDRPPSSDVSFRKLLIANKSSSKEYSNGIASGNQDQIQEAEIEMPRDPAHQRKKPEERFWLQVDRQTKKSFATLAPAEEAGELIKKAHPIVQVSIYDSVDCVNTLIGADPVPARAAAEAKAAD